MEWIKLKDSKPEHRHWVLVIANKTLFLAQYKHGIFETEIPTILHNVTHWMPIPLPPNDI